MKLVNARLKSEREMMEHLVLKGDLFDNETGLRLYFSETKAKSGRACFFIERTEGTSTEIAGYWWSEFKAMQKEITLEDAVKAGKKVPCWKDDSKTRTCVVDGITGSGNFTEGSVFFNNDPIPIEPYELL